MCNIIQVAATREGRAFNGYTVPELPLSKEVTDLTGFVVNGPYLYRHGVLKQTLPVKDLLRCFIDYLRQFNRPLLVAHNAKNFDAPVLMRVLAENGLQQKFKEVACGFVDTYQLSRCLYPSLPSHSLKALVSYFVGQSFEAHDGLEDAKILEKLFIAWNPSDFHVDMCTNRF